MSGISDLDQYGKQCPLVVTFEPLAQTWHLKVWWWKAKSMECENIFIATFRRTRAGLNPEPGTDQLSTYLLKSHHVCT